MRGAYETISLTMKELLEKLRGPEGTHSFYLAGDNLEENFPGLLPYVAPLPVGRLFRKEDLASLGLWVGRSGQVQMFLIIFLCSIPQQAGRVLILIRLPTVTLIAFITS